MRGLLLLPLVLGFASTATSAFSADNSDELRDERRFIEQQRSLPLCSLEVLFADDPWLRQDPIKRQDHLKELIGGFQELEEVDLYELPSEAIGLVLGHTSNIGTNAPRPPSQTYGVSQEIEEIFAGNPSRADFYVRVANQFADWRGLLINERRFVPGVMGAIPYDERLGMRGGGRARLLSLEKDASGRRKAIELTIEFVGSYADGRELYIFRVDAYPHSIGSL